MNLHDILNESGFQGETKVAEQKKEVSSNESMLKIASELGIYNEFFPEDANLGQQKTAEEVKLAQYQNALGARAYDYASLRFDQRMSKIANELSAASDMEAAQGIMQAAGGAAPQSFPTNYDPMDKAPRVPGATPYSLQAGAEHGAEGQVGMEEQQKIAMELAERKHFLLAALNQ